MNLHISNNPKSQKDSTLFKVLALAILSMLLLVFAKNARDIVPASTDHQIVELTDTDDLVSGELEQTDITDVCHYFDISGPTWARGDVDSPAADTLVTQAPAQQVENYKH